MKKLLALTAIALTVLTGCRIDNPTYKFKVKVISPSGVPIQNVVVEASVDVPGHREEAFMVDTTSFDGTVEFEYDYEAVFKILGTRGEDPYTHIGCGFVKLEPNAVVEENIVLLPYNPSDPGC